MKKVLFLFIAVFFATTSFAQKDVKKITVDDLWTNWTFYAQSVHGLRSMDDGLNYTTMGRRGDIVKYSYKTGDVVDSLLKTSSLDIGRVTDYIFNADETKILLLTNKTRIYRRSFTADYFVYDIKAQKADPLSENGAQQIASFSPDGKKVAFARKNNLFIKFLDSGKELQVTTDGQHNKIINGVPDWVYEEEFAYNKAYTWMPDSKKLAFVKFDESDVKVFGMPIYAGKAPHYKENELYPEFQTFKYPKAGEDNSVVSVHVFDLKSQQTIACATGKNTDIYIPRIRPITGTNKLAIFRVNRLQNRLDILSANTKTGQTTDIFTEKNEYYLEDAYYDNVYFFEDGEHFLVTAERDGYRHIYMQGITADKLTQVTKGKWDVTAFYGYDAKTKQLYFEAAKESPLRREVYSIGLDGKDMKKLSDREGTNHANFSADFSYFINYFSNINTPTAVTLHKTDGTKLRTLRDNSPLLKKIDKYGGVHKEFFTIKTSEGTVLNAYMVKPANFDSTKKYPVIIDQYSGPASQEVKDSWSFGWHNLLAQEGAIVVGVDPRGTGARGEKFRKMTYLQLGKYETIDLIETAKFLQTLNYVNADKIGIWGWSYGGFETLLCLTKGADVFAAGIAVAPVTNWRYYDNIYTERFMRKPQNNASGYDDNSPINFVENLEDPLLIVHGTADDNVHLQNTKEFTEAMVQAGKQFRMHEYTNRNHSIYGGQTRHHLYSMMLEFWRDNLLK
ncbi:MAG: S9 family peptidase [Bacteroidota bacterium]|nr:S9 family peptidase [Bacteroidota bacterium]